MSINFQAVNETLGNIRTSLEGLSTSVASATPEQRRQLNSGLNALSGTLSSTQARQAVQTAQAQSGVNPEQPSRIDPLQEAIQARAQAESRAKQAEAKRAEAEATASIADQRMLKGQRTASTTGGEASAPTTDAVTTLQELMQTEPELADFGITEENINDPIVLANVRFMAAREKQIANDLNRLNDFVARKENRVKQQVALIDQSMMNQSEQIKIEQRKRMAAVGMAGILSNRGLYSPEEHQGLVQEVVQEGILKLQEIQIEGFKLQNQMWEAFEEFEYQAYVEGSQMLKEINKLELDTVTAIQTRIQEVEKAEREKLLFDQAQQERNAFVLAPELMNATPEEIKAAAIANGIDVGLLAREATAYRQSQQMFNLDVRDKELSILSKEESIAASRAARASAQAKAEPAMSKETREIYEKRFGVTIPPGMPESLFLALNKENQGAEPRLFEAKLWEANLLISADLGQATVETIRDNIGTDKDTRKVTERLAKLMGIRKKNAETVLDNELIQTMIGEQRFLDQNASSQTILNRVALVVQQDQKLERQNRNNFSGDELLTGNQGQQSFAPVSNRLDTSNPFSLGGSSFNLSEEQRRRALGQ